MLTTLALIVLVAAITVFFSQELIKFLKKIFAIKGAQLFLPLAIASWAVYTFDYWFLWAIYYYRECLNTIQSYLVYLIPIPNYSHTVALIILLTSASVIPVFVWDKATRKRSFKWYVYPYVASTILWIITSIVLLLL